MRVFVAGGIGVVARRGTWPAAKAIASMTPGIAGPHGPAARQRHQPEFNVQIPRRRLT